MSSWPTMRIEYPGAYYYVTSRGNQAIFQDEQDRVTSSFPATGEKAAFKRLTILVHFKAGMDNWSSPDDILGDRDSHLAFVDWSKNFMTKNFPGMRRLAILLAPFRALTVCSRCRFSETVSSSRSCRNVIKIVAREGSVKLKVGSWGTGSGSSPGCQSTG